MQRGKINRKAVLWAAFLFALALAQGLPCCTGEIGTDLDGSIGPDHGKPVYDGPAVGDGPSNNAPLLWKTSQAHLGAIHALTARDTVLYVSADTGLYLFVLGMEAKPKCASQSGGATTPIKAAATLDASGNAYFTRAAEQCLASIDPGCNHRWDMGGLNYFDCKASSDTRPVLVDNESTVVIGTVADANGASHIWGVNSGSGAESWHHTLDGSSIRRSLVLGGGTIYAGVISGGVGQLHALAAPDYTPTQIFLASEFRAPALVASDGNVVIGDWNKNLHAVSTTGTQKWKGVAQGRIITAPVEGPNGLILVAASIGGIYTHSLSGGAMWSYGNTMVHNSGVAVDSKGTAYIGAEGGCSPGNATGGCLHAVRDGQVLWSYETERPVNATPVVHDQMVIVGDDGGSLYALKLE